MLKLKTSTGHVINSYDIYELWRFIVSNDFQYSIFLNYEPISYDTFLKMFLVKTKNWKDYHSMYLKLKPTITLKEYLL